MEISQLDSEELYCKLRKNVQKEKENLITNKNVLAQMYSFTKEEIYKAKKYICFDNDNQSSWVCANFDSDIDEKSNLTPIIKNEFSQKTITKQRNGIELRNLIFRTVDVINYKITNNKIKSSFILKGESDFWLFLHVKNDKFDENTIVILFSKEEFCENVHMSMGTFIKNDNKNKKYILKFFQTLQLVKSYKNEVNYDHKYENTDCCLIKIVINDDGSENLKISAWMNEGSAENILIGKFCKQISMYNKDMLLRMSSSSSEINNNYKVMIAGNGVQCKVTQFSCETFYKDTFDDIEGLKSNYNGCNCCKIF